MWIYLPGGLVMPASVDPADHVDDKYTLGVRDIQVRGRLPEHLEQFMADFMDPYGLGHSEVVLTPAHDYPCRFYCTKEDFAQAMVHAVMDIDYRRFKPSSEDRKAPDGVSPRYKKAAQYHKVLLSVWSATLGLGTAGSFYGPWSEDNPDGYRTRLFGDADDLYGPAQDEEDRYYRTRGAAAINTDDEWPNWKDR